MKNYNFSIFNEYAKNGITESLKELNESNKSPVVVCIGSDLVLGDSLGPLVGTFLKQNFKRQFIYGTLNEPITAKEVDYARKYLKELHPETLIIAIDAAIGNQDDIGLIKISNKPIKPGLGVNKNLKEIGDVSIMGIVATKSVKNYNLYNLTRLNLIYKMAKVIADGLTDYFDIFEKAQTDNLLENVSAKQVI